MVNVIRACVCCLEEGFQPIFKEQHIILNCQLIKEMLMVNVIMVGVCILE
jgi:hypothetical protein